MTKTQSHDEVWVWIREVKVNHPALEAFMDLISVSGMRLSEAVNSYNLIVKLAGEKKLDTYFNGEKGWLEHFHFPDLFIRDSKKTFVSFVPFELVEKISKVQALGGVRLKGEVNRFSDIRELHATFMTRFLKKEEIDFLHGRVTSGVFMQNYFNPSLISDLKARAFQGIAEIQEKIKT
jgi:intergrase/recombinase